MSEEQMQIIKNKEGSDTVYAVYRDGQRVATVCKGWLRLGGCQWVANMANRAPFGEPTLKAMWRRIEALAREGA
jgi:GH24 family phage-related lysozyme (muramidase)